MPSAVNKSQVKPKPTEKLHFFLLKLSEMFKYWIKLIFSMNVPLLILNVRYIVIIARNIFKKRRVTSVYNRPKN